MYKKMLIVIGAITLILTGCVRMTNQIDTTIESVMAKEIVKDNTVSTGYKLYIPTGVKQVSDNDFNQKLKIRNRYVYLYVDTISYYYKNILNYKKSEEYNYYYKEIKLNDKEGYVGINKLDDGTYFCEIIYNYSKIEFYSDEEDLSIILANSLIILNSISFNDELIKLGLESSNTDGREVKYELDKPKDSESTFSKYLQEYVAEEEIKVELPDDN